MTEPLKVLLFLSEGFEDLEAVSIIDVMGWTEYREWVPRVKVDITGFHSKIKSRFGLTISPTIPFEEIRPEEFTALAIPGGFHSHGFDEAYDDRLRDLARTFHAQQRWIATFCVGVLPVAEAGLLKGKLANSYPFSRNHDNLARLRELGAQVEDKAMVVDDRIISCAGPASALDVSYYLLETLIGKEYCQEVRRLMCAPQ